VRSSRNGWTAAVALVLAAAAAGCAGDATPPETNEGPWTALSDRPCPTDSFLTYESFGSPFFSNYCRGCHSSALAADARQLAPLEVNFDTVDDIRALSERVWLRAADGNATMPPAGGPVVAERDLLGEWLACGAPLREEP